MPRVNSFQVATLLASFALAGGGIALLSSARNAPVHNFSPVPGVAPADAAPAPEATPKAPVKVPDDIQWRTNFQAALQEARTSGKPLMVDFYTDWCGYCKKLDKEVYTDFGVIAESVNFVSVKINAEKSQQLAAQYQVSGFPTILWLDGNGKAVERLPGYADAPEFLQIMRSAKDKLAVPAA
jgi:thiol:disulfide interchange protein